MRRPSHRRERTATRIHKVMRFVMVVSIPIDNVARRHGERHSMASPDAGRRPVMK